MTGDDVLNFNVSEDARVIGGTLALGLNFKGGDLLAFLLQD